MKYNEAKLHYLLLFNKLKDIDEQLIATSSWYSYEYALGIIEGRFILGEEAIATDSLYSFYYARDILKGRFELGEAAIVRSIYRNRYNHFLREQGINFELL